MDLAMRCIIRAGISIAFLAASSCQAQTAASGPTYWRALPIGNFIMSCDRLPPGAVKFIPAPFDRYMQFECNKYLGQGLHAVDGFHWADPRGYGIGLSSASAAGSPDANGNRSFRFSWYTQLMPINLAVVEQQARCGRTSSKQVPPCHAFLMIVSSMRRPSLN